MKESRGIGGIFFDDWTEGGFEKEKIVKGPEDEPSITAVEEKDCDLKPALLKEINDYCEEEAVEDKSAKQIAAAPEQSGRLTLNRTLATGNHGKPQQTG